MLRSALRGHTRQTAGLAIGVSLALSLLSPESSAMGVLVGTRTHVEILDRKLLWVRSDSGDRLVEAVELQNPPARFAWLRAFPTKPARVVRAGPGLFDALREETAVPEPFREHVKARKFGPSILSLAFSEAPTEAPTEEPTLSSRSQPFAVETLRYFEGQTTTSTITRRKRLPESFESWLVEQNLVLSPLQFNALAEVFDRGWVLAATSYAGLPAADRLWLGPVVYELADSSGAYPARQFGPQSPREREFEIYTIGPTPLLPEAKLEWSERPWAESEAPRDGWLRTRYHQPIELGTRLALEPQLEFSIPEQGSLAAGVMRFEVPPSGDLAFTAREPDAVPRLPGRGGRGSVVDLLLVLLLGLLPLLYTPESWLLLYVGHRFREARRRDADAPTWGLLLWPFYALGVALYYLVTLEDLARTAALLPLVLAALRLATPAPDPEREFFFRFRPKKAPKKSVAPARKSVGPPRKSAAPPGPGGDVRRTGDLRPVQEPENLGALRPSAGPTRPSGGPPAKRPSEPSGES